MIFYTGVPKEIIGDPQLGCAAMTSSGNCCSQCGCSYKVHQHIYYETNEVEDKKLDSNIDREIKTKEQAEQKAKELINKMEQEIVSFENRKIELTKAMAKFAHFLKANALISVNDAIEKYIKQMIENYKTIQAKSGGNEHIIEQLNHDLAKYIEEKVF